MAKLETSRIPERTLEKVNSLKKYLGYTDEILKKLPDSGRGYIQRYCILRDLEEEIPILEKNIEPEIKLGVIEGFAHEIAKDFRNQKIATANKFEIKFGDGNKVIILTSTTRTDYVKVFLNNVHYL